MWKKIKAWIVKREEGIEFIFVLIFAFVLFFVLYELSFIPFPEGTLGP